MNAMFFIDGTLITPALSGSILDGVTRDSLLAIAKDIDMKMEVRPIKATELVEAFEAGKRVEAFGAGTAAVVAPIESISIDGNSYNCYIGEDAQMFQLKKALSAIRHGSAPDKFNWNYIL